MTTDPTQALIARLRELHTAATPGPWDVWRERTDTRDDAVAELTAQVASSEPFAGAVFLLNAEGKCPATTGCGPTSEANAALIVEAINALPAILDALASLTAPEGWVMVPKVATRAWALTMANLRQGRSDTPRCEAPGEYEIKWAFERISEALEAAPMLAAASPSPPEPKP